MRKPLMVMAIVALLILTVVGSLLPFLQGWIFFVFALYLFASEFETGRKWVRRARRRWPALSRWIGAARDHRWAPKQLRHFDELTDPLDRPIGREVGTVLVGTSLFILVFFLYPSPVLTGAKTAAAALFGG